MKCFRSKKRSCLCKIVLLDHHELIQEVQESTLGQELLDIVFRHLNLLETAYFGLRYLKTTNQSFWLEPKKKVINQIQGCGPYTIYFCVKFYSADPCRLLEEITRYQFFLQVKQDIAQGRLPVSDIDAAELGARIVQAELGDFDSSQHCAGYVSEFQICPKQTTKIEDNVMEIHKTLRGQSPAMTEYSFLEKVRWLEMYGVDLHPVLGEDQTEYFVGLTPSGIMVLRGQIKVGNYFWPRINKVFCKGKYFMLRVRERDKQDTTFGFETPSKQTCKQLWRCAVEHHSFFRLLQDTQQQLQQKHPRGKQLPFSNRFRFSGRSSSEVRRESGQRRCQPSFSRSSSRRSLTSTGSAPNLRISADLDSRSLISIPQPANSLAAMQRATSMTFDSQSRPDSPRSVRSVPYSPNQLSALISGSCVIGRPRRSASADSQSSFDHSAMRRKQKPCYDSDGSSVSMTSRSHRKHRHRREESGSESDRSGSSRKHRSRRHRGRENDSVMVDSEPQWREIQRRQAEGILVATSCSSPAAGITTSSSFPATRSAPPTGHRSGYQNSGMETESEMSFENRRRVRKHRSRSRSPESERLRRLPPELRQHLQFELVEAAADLSQHEASIPYTRIETTSRLPRVRYAAKRSQRSLEESDSRLTKGLPASQSKANSSPTFALTIQSSNPPISTLVSSISTLASPTASSTPLTSSSHYSVPTVRPRPLKLEPVAAISSNTLSNFYVTQPSAISLSSPMQHSSTLSRMNVPLRPPPRFVQRPSHGGGFGGVPERIPEGIHGGVPGRGPVVDPANHEHSDSGLGNESPNEFMRLRENSSPPVAPLPPAMPPVGNLSASCTLPRHYRFTPSSNQRRLAVNVRTTDRPWQQQVSQQATPPLPCSRATPVLQPPASFRNTPSPDRQPLGSEVEVPAGTTHEAADFGFVGEMRQLLASTTNTASSPMVERLRSTYRSTGSSPDPSNSTADQSRDLSSWRIPYSSRGHLVAEGNYSSRSHLVPEGNYSPGDELASGIDSVAPVGQVAVRGHCNTRVVPPEQLRSPLTGSAH